MAASSKKLSATISSDDGNMATPQTEVKFQHATAIDTKQEKRFKGLETILAVDDRVRNAKSVRELHHAVVNESRKITGARQIFLARHNGSGTFRIKAVSSLALVERDTPLIRWVEGALGRLTQERGMNDQVEFALPAFVDPNADESKTYPFRHLVWQPLKLTSGETFAGLLFAKERVWESPELRVIGRQAGVFANAWQALVGKRALKPVRKIRKNIAYVLAASFLLAACIPVPLTALAPVEIIERNAGIVAAPIDGVIAEILVKPNETVSFGQPILRFEDTTLRNRFQIADREMDVAKTKYDRAQRAAFSDPKSRHELQLAKTEYELKKAERDYAADILARAEVNAPRDGILIYSNQNKLIGRPVKTGERLMKIGAPNEIQARIDLPVSDAIILEKETQVRLFLDAEPFQPRLATVMTESYHAEPNATQQLVYKIRADLNEDDFYPRIGSRGTAQIYGQNVPLFFFLLRKPISAFRQYFGL